jgi:hypothetical protein
VTAATLRTYSATACVPAALVVLGHLALRWNSADGFAGRRDLAFSHGVALAVVLAAVLIASRFALYLENGTAAPFADSLAVVGTVAVLADLARVWRDGSDPLHSIGITASHLAALLVVALSTIAAGRIETARRRTNTTPSL